MPPRTLTVTLPPATANRSYPIHIGRGLLNKSALYRSHLTSRQVLIVTNTTVAPLYLDAVRSALVDYHVNSLILPDGEQYKDLATWQQIFDVLLTHRYGRDCTLIAVGGGVIGDMTGFAAACYQRGVAFIQVPTTLLAQVDSSVGGKTGINHPAGKNMIGAFHQPVAVIADTDTLNTLPDRELSAGFAEVIKYGLIRDLDFFNWLAHHADGLLARDPALLATAIERSCQHKAEIVEADEYESGQRALLNLGHTFGHAIETGTGYGNWLHGEAIAVGMVMAADLSHRLGWLTNEDVERVRQVLAAFQLPITAPPELTADQMLDLMAVDKKVLQGKLRLVLLPALGTAQVTSDVPMEQLRATLTAA